MAQTPKKIRRLPKDIADRPGREIMERIFGKRIMLEVDAIVSERSQDVEDKSDTSTMKRG